MNLIHKLLDRACGETARFESWDLPYTNITVLTCANELARDAMGETCKTTRSVVDSIEVRRALLNVTSKPSYERCGSTFTNRIWGE